MPVARAGRTALATATVLSTAALMAVTALGTAPTALAKGGEVGGSGNEFFLSNTFGTRADVELTYGSPGDDVFVGDWDGDGTDTLAVRRGAQFHVRNTNTSGGADRTFVYGRPGDVVLVGDWDGDGTDTLAVRRGAVYHVKNSLTGGPADREVVYGRVADTVLVGDWDGDGDDTFAVRRGSQYFVKNTIAAGSADEVAVYGRAADTVLVGDWDGDGDDTFAVRRGAQYLIANAIRPGSADEEVVYGRTDDTTLVGDWDGDGDDTLGVRRGVPFRSSVSPVTAASLGASWRPGCPVPVTHLRAVDVTHLGYDGTARTGRLVVAEDVAADVVAIMADLYRAGFRIERMQPVAAYGADDDASMAANNTSAFNCRAVTGGNAWSEHSFGEAIDINPRTNPYVLGDTVLPPAGRNYLDRGRDAPGMIRAGDAVVTAFAARGWGWGGAWTSPVDYQHFSTSGR